MLRETRTAVSQLWSFRRHKDPVGNGERSRSRHSLSKNLPTVCHCLENLNEAEFKKIVDLFQNRIEFRLCHGYGSVLSSRSAAREKPASKV